MRAEPSQASRRLPPNSWIGRKWALHCFCCTTPKASNSSGAGKRMLFWPGRFQRQHERHFDGFVAREGRASHRRDGGCASSRSCAQPTLTLPPNWKRERDVTRYGPLGSWRSAGMHEEIRPIVARADSFSWSRCRLSELGKARGPDLSCGLRHVAPPSDRAGSPADPMKMGVETFKREPTGCRQRA
ncbi:hypothetical protein GGD66_002293 [Bradyrhizobium sp. CIR48]|nr:hypothetical protein [Bradyrhizobium sp. CIR48]